MLFIYIMLYGMLSYTIKSYNVLNIEKLCYTICVVSKSRKY